MNSRGGACSPADSDVDNIHFGTERVYLFDARALDDFYFYSFFSYSSYLLERKWICSFSSPLSYEKSLLFPEGRHSFESPRAVVTACLRPSCLQLLEIEMIFVRTPQK